ncbi:MAG: hypothetical protein QOD41_128 [Cryptosporangiaceae bacterium]|nr:hypothetical protein [Cryptosporangiaceae bacterium]
MGKDVPAASFTPEDRRRYRQKVRRNLDVFARMLRESRFDFDRPLAGLEIELNLVNAEAEPTRKNTEVLDAIADPAWCTEMGQFNLEINVPPLALAGQGLAELERTVRASLNDADKAARTAGARLVMVGILPTLREHDVDRGAISQSPRYHLLNDQIFAARGEDIRIAIDGPERLSTYADSVAPEAACTSVQFHLQVSPTTFPSYWNAAQAVAGVQLAAAANSPFLFGKELWRETRIPLFGQATDTRPEEFKAQGVRPRVWFGERWITSVFDLFEENARYFPALLPLCDAEDPLEVLDRGDVPALSELTLHNGTIYRWNRPVYAVVAGKPHLRVENRTLPSGPTVVDIVANGALYYGLVRALAEAERPVWSQMSFSAAEDNLQAAARHGMDSHLYWPGLGEVPANELILRRLLPLAYSGLDAWGVDPAERDRLLGIIEQRCLTGQNGASWQVETLHALDSKGGASRHECLQQMTHLYIDHMHTNDPVHTWPIP